MGYNIHKYSGVNDIRKHRWFQGFDWEGLRSEKIVAPFIPGNILCYAA